MDSVLTALFSWQFLIFCFGIVAITQIFRRLVEFFVLDNPKMPGTRTSKFWRDVVLPIFPILCGATLGLVAVKFPFPEGINSISAREMFSLSAGLLSSWLWRYAKGMLGKKDKKEDSKEDNTENK